MIDKCTNCGETPERCNCFNKACPMCGSGDPKVRLTSHFGGIPVMDCLDSWHVEAPEGK